VAFFYIKIQEKDERARNLMYMDRSDVIKRKWKKWEEKEKSDHPEEEKRDGIETGMERTQLGSQRERERETEVSKRQDNANYHEEKGKEKKYIEISFPPRCRI
jgi:hypothetical protein